MIWLQVTGETLHIGWKSIVTIQEVQWSWAFVLHLAGKLDLLRVVSAG